MSFFTKLDEAIRYAQSRPAFHHLVIARAKEAAGIARSVPLGLDAACGTGQSTAALTSIADRVIGFDSSKSMLAVAEQNERVRYVRARAEAMPFRNNFVSIISCALAFHWFDREPFLGEVGRVLDDEGLLLIYNNGFTGKMREDPAFLNWSQNVYRERFPVPPRNSKPLTPEEAAVFGFLFLKEDRYENDVRFTPEELVAYLGTQTNVAAAVEQDWESLESARRWLLEQVSPFFANKQSTFVFATTAWYLQKEPARWHHLRLKFT